MYIDFDYYNSHFNTLTESQFNEVHQQAEDMLDLITCNRASSIATSSYKYYKIQHTVCTLCDKLYFQKQSSVGAGVTSVSNDGYSESYAIVTESEKQQELRSVCFAGLSGTGLMGVL